MQDFRLEDDMFEDSYNFMKQARDNWQSLPWPRKLARNHFQNASRIFQQGKFHCSWSQVYGIEVEKMFPLITYLVASKLPERLRTVWKNLIIDNTKYPHFDSLASFLSNRCFAFETYHAILRSKSPAVKNAYSDKAKKNGASTTIAKMKGINSSSKCVLCSRDHYLFWCPQFLEKTVLDKLPSAVSFCCRVQLVYLSKMQSNSQHFVVLRNHSRQAWNETIKYFTGLMEPATVVDYND